MGGPITLVNNPEKYANVVHLSYDNEAQEPQIISSMNLTNRGIYYVFLGEDKWETLPDTQPREPDHFLLLLEEGLDFQVVEDEQSVTFTINSFLGAQSTSSEATIYSTSNEEMVEGQPEPEPIPLSVIGSETTIGISNTNLMDNTISFEFDRRARVGDKIAIHATPEEDFEYYIYALKTNGSWRLKVLSPGMLLL